MRWPGSYYLWASHFTPHAVNRSAWAEAGTASGTAGRDSRAHSGRLFQPSIASWTWTSGPSSDTGSPRNVQTKRGSRTSPERKAYPESVISQRPPFPPGSPRCRRSPQ